MSSASAFPFREVAELCWDFPAMSRQSGLGGKEQELIKQMPYQSLAMVSLEPGHSEPVARHPLPQQCVCPGVGRRPALNQCSCDCSEPVLLAPVQGEPTVLPAGSLPGDGLWAQLEDGTKVTQVIPHL